MHSNKELIYVPLFIIGLYYAFFNSPADYQMGDTVRIMYVHVPAAILAMYVLAAVMILTGAAEVNRGGALAFVAVVTAAGLSEVEPGDRVLVGGVVTHRQRPATAGGTLFVNLEDETGLINVVVSKGCWAAHRKVARTAPAMLVRGRLERSEGVTNVIADRLEPLPLTAPTKSRDFR